MNTIPLKICTLCMSFVVFFSFPIAPAVADDEVVYTGEPVFKIISKNDSLKILEQSITIKRTQVTSSYLIENDSGNVTEASVIIEIPPVAWRGAGNWYPDRSYSELRLYINGAKVDYTRQSKAFLKDKDITGLLLEYGLKPNDLGNDEMWAEGMTPEIAKRYVALQNAGALNDGPFPQWEARNTYLYKFTMQAKEEVNIRYEYIRLPGEFYFNESYAERSGLLNQIGLNWDDMRQKYDGGKSSDDYYRIKYMFLPLWPGSWKNAPKGIPVVNLDIQPGRDSDGRKYLIALALKGGSVLGKESLRLKLENFNQDSPLLIQIKPLFNSKNM